MKKGILFSLIAVSCVIVFSFTIPHSKEPVATMPPDVVIEECSMSDDGRPTTSQQGWALTAKAMYILAGYNCVTISHSTWDWGNNDEHAYEVCMKVSASNTPCP